MGRETDARHHFTEYKQDIQVICEKLKAEAHIMQQRGYKNKNKQMAKHGNEIVPQNATILTHCNTGALATVGYGSCLRNREAHNTGRAFTYADETRPNSRS